MNKNDLNIEVLYDVPVEISVVLGRAKMNLKDVLKLNKGAVITLDRNIGEYVDVYVNDKKVARGEIVIVDNQIGITLTEVIVTTEKLQAFSKNEY